MRYELLVDVVTLVWGCASIALGGDHDRIILFVVTAMFVVRAATGCLACVVAPAIAIRSYPHPVSKTFAVFSVLATRVLMPMLAFAIVALSLSALAVSMMHLPVALQIYLSGALAIAIASFVRIDRLFTRVCTRARRRMVVGVATFNVQRCHGLDNVRDYGRTASALLNLSAEILCLQECNDASTIHRHVRDANYSYIEGARGSELAIFSTLRFVGDPVRYVQRILHGV
jgi:hypothetical protein